MCFSRPRRFGKTMAANMLAAYYDESCDSTKLFRGLKIEQDPTYLTHLNKYPVIKLDSAYILSQVKKAHDSNVNYETIVLRDLEEEYPELKERGMTTLGDAILYLYRKSGKRFIVTSTNGTGTRRRKRNRKKYLSLFSDYKETIAYSIERASYKGLA